MEKKELIKLYLQNVDKMFGYANMNAYIDERLKKYTKYCQSKKPEEQIIIWLKLLHENFGKTAVATIPFTLGIFYHIYSVQTAFVTLKKYFQKKTDLVRMQIYEWL